MAKKKTSAEMAKEQSEIAKVEGMLGDAFGSLGGLEQTTQEEVEEQISEDSAEEVESITEENNETPSDGIVEDAQNPVKEVNSPPTGPPSGPPSKPPSGPPSMPPSEAITEDAPIVDKTPSSPPSGPPSKPPSGPPSKPPNLPADESKSEVSEEILEENNQQNESIESSSDEDTQQEIVEDEGDDNIASVAKQSDNEETDVEKEEKDSVEAPEEVVDSTSNDLLNPPTINDDLEGEDIVAKEAEIARLSAEVERLRHSMSGAADIIEEMENPPMPPMIQEDVVIGAHIVADMARMARQLDRDQLIRASMGTIAMLHPERFDVLISTKHKSLLPRMNEKDICAGKLNSEPPRGAPTDWRVLEVLLASTNIVTGGPAAVIHCHGPYSTAVSCEKDLVLMQPIDEIGKEHIGKVIIVDPDDENPREYLRQVAEALKQGGMRCVVIRGNGAYAVGADLDQAWANAAMLEHSMKIVMLARQANLKI